MLSDPVNGEVFSLVPHQFSESAAQSEGLTLRPTDIGKPTWPFASMKNDQSTSSVSGSNTLARARRLAQEVVTLSTGLPLSEQSSVFVRVDEKHVAMLKVSKLDVF